MVPNYTDESGIIKSAIHWTRLWTVDFCMLADLDGDKWFNVLTGKDNSLPSPGVFDLVLDRGGARQIAQGIVT